MKRRNIRREGLSPDSQVKDLCTSRVNHTAAAAAAGDDYGKIAPTSYRQFMLPSDHASAAAAKSKSLQHPVFLGGHPSKY